MSSKPSGSESFPVAEILREGDKLILPAQMSTEDALTLLKRRMSYENERVVMQETFDVFPLDGACALDTVLQRLYGWAPAVPTPGFFQDHPPELISVEIGPGIVRKVPWGSFEIPNVTGRVCSASDTKDGRQVFSLHAYIYRRDEQTIKALFDEVREETRRTSIYRGKTIRLRLFDSDGDKLSMPEPTFIDNRVEVTSLVFSDSVLRAINTNLFVPITRARDFLASGISLKRGVLLTGPFGVGKTLTAAVAARLAEDAGITSIYVPRAQELAEALHFARQYESPACLVFCEDIDRTMSGPRSARMDDILNTIDGLDAKGSNIILLLTTNAVEDIHPAMLRPGRLDAVINVTPPDASAVERLVRLNGGTAIARSADLSAVGQLLAGQNPATIAEVVTRAKLAQLAMQSAGTSVQQISVEALLEAVQSVKTQIELIPQVRADDVGELGLDRAFSNALKQAFQDGFGLLQDMRSRLDDLEEKIDDAA